MNLTNRDWLLIVSGGIISLAMGWWGTTIALPQLLAFEWYSALPLIPVTVIVAYFVYRFQSVWGGEMVRDLTLLGISVVVGTTLNVVHIRWHIVGTGFQNLPAWGISTDFWLVFFHIGTAAVYLLTAYSAYQLYQSQE